MNECKSVTYVFSSLNFTIKSVLDNAFSENKDSILKDKALNMLFKNMFLNMSDCLKKWRTITKVDQVRGLLNEEKKGSVIKMLEGFLNNNLNYQLRKVINKFRINRRITDIQRNFIKKLLLSRAGMVVIAFRKIQTLPEKVKT